ncbi:MAG TPA: AsmA-like C-terminal region-containing protein [Elusimicrobiota bacterium]|nr:AsmA-like C-terminal region-containing protein [Elusimicrobiota bacterium]
MERRRILKFTLLFFAVLIAAGAGGLAFLIDRALSAPGLKPRIERAAAEFLGRPVTIDSLEWRRKLGVLVGSGFKVYDDETRTRLLVDSPTVEAHVALLSVHKLAAGVTELRFVSPRVFLRRGSDGVWNAERLAGEIAARPPGKKRDWGTLAFNWFTVVGGTATVEDAAGGLNELGPLAVSGQGKLKFGRRHAHFPFTLDVLPLRAPARIAVTGSLGGRWRVHAELKGASPALAAAAWPPARLWTGRVSASLDHDERRDPAWRVSARAAPLAVSTAAPRIELLALTGEYRPGAATRFDAVLRSSATEISAKGSLGEKVLDAAVTSPETDLPTVLALAGALAPKAPPSAPSRPRAGSKPATRRLTARVSAELLHWGPVELAGARAVVRRSTGAYEIEAASFRCFGGSVLGRGSYLPGGGDAALALAWTASGLDLQRLFRAAGTSREAAGSIDSSGSIRTGAGDRFLGGMSGAAQADLKNGWLGGMPGLLKVLSRLNLTTLLAEAAGRHRSRVPFDEAHLAVTVAGGKLSTTRPLVLKNKTLLLAYMGSYDLPTRTVDGKVVVHVVTVTDEIIRLIPGVRDVLLGGRKSMLPIWLKVTGKADDPDVDVLPTKTIAAPFWNTIKNVFKLPKRLSMELGL